MTNQIVPTKNTSEVGDVTLAIFIDTRRPVKDKNRPRAITFPVKIRVTHKCKRIYYATGQKLTFEEWETFGTKSNKAWNSVSNRLDVIKDHISDIIEHQEFSFDELQARLGRGKKTDVFAYMEAHAKELRKKGQIKTAITFECALSSIKKYTKTETLQFKQINQGWIEGYVEHMRELKNKTTTRSIYLRALRALINKAKQPDPFGEGKYEIQKGEGRQIALSKDQIDKLLSCPIVIDSTTHRMRDLFEFSYRCNGINFKDMLSLKWTDIQNNEIIWKRAKTDRKNPKERFIHAFISDKLQAIINRRGVRDSKYIFGYLNDQMTAEEKKDICDNVIRLTNKHLKLLSEKLGLPHVSTYCARHSFATILNSNKIPVSHISEALGHGSILTTQSYLNRMSADERKTIANIID